MTTPGWYDDGYGAIRWWDGSAWTDYVAAPPAGQGMQQPPGSVVPQYAPGGYPATYPATYPVASDGAYMMAPEPRPSRSWIIWVTLGVVLVGVVVAIALLTPIVLTGLAAGSRSGGGGTPTSADRQAAVDTVVQYNDAWLTADCEGYFATTTEELREASELTDCDDFAFESRSLVGGVEDYETMIRDVETVGSAITVSTTESYSSIYNDDGTPADEPIDYEDRYEYIVVRSEEGWVIDDFYLE